MEKQMIDLSDKLEGYENYVTQDADGYVYKWEFHPIVEYTNLEWGAALDEQLSNDWSIANLETIPNPNWKESLVDLSTHAPYLINGILTGVPKPTTKPGELPYGARKKQTTDVVNKPEHYRQGDIECIDAITSATTYKLGIAAVCVANVIKYLWRYESKNGLEDVKKAQWYLNKLVMEMEENGKSFSLKQGEKKDDKKVL